MLCEAERMEKSKENAEGQALRRSLLFVPCSSEKMLAKASLTNADGIILDLEDSVSIPEKELARSRAAEFIDEIKSTGKEAIVRINGVGSVYCVEDILMSARAQADGIMLPKADVRSTIAVDVLLEAEEIRQGLKKDTIKLIPLVETANGLINAFQTFGVTKRINAAILGMEDLSKELGVQRTKNGTEAAYPRNVLVCAAKACGIDIIDTPYTDINDIAGLEQDTFTALQTGFTGKACIHPKHAETINRIFSPSEEELASARKIIEAYTIAIANGQGACTVDGKMIDVPIVERAERILKKSILINNGHRE